jgi:hypothetical protein
MNVIPWNCNYLWYWHQMSIASRNIETMKITYWHKKSHVVHVLQCTMCSFNIDDGFGPWKLNSPFIFEKNLCYDIKFGITIKVRAWKGVGQECNLGVTFALLGKVWEGEGWTHTFPNRLPLWDLQRVIRLGQNSLNWRVLNRIGKLLKCRCLKWARMIHLNIYNTSYGRNKGQKSKCQFDSQPLKVGNHSYLHVCKGHAIHLRKLLTRVTTLF